MQTAAHPLNKYFDWQPAEGPLRLLNRQHIEQFNRDGYCVLKNVIPTHTIAEITEATDRADAFMEAQLRKMENNQIHISKGGKFTVSTHVAAQNRSVNKFANSTLFKDICMDLMGTEVQLYHDQLVYKKPGMQENFPWHQDNGYVYIEPQQYITCWIPLVDADEENGCPWVVPGLHKQGTLNHKNSEYGYVCIDEKMPEQAISAPVKAGDIHIFSSLCPHMTGPNKTKQIRKSYIVQYCSKNARRVLYNRKTGKRHFSLKINAAFDYFIMKQILRPYVFKHVVKMIAKATKPKK